MDHVVTAFLRNRGEVLLLRRSEEVGSYPGLWGGVSGYVEGGLEAVETDARREIREEVGRDDARLVRAGDPLTVEDEVGAWTVHPFLFEADSRAVDPNYEVAEWEWVPPPAMHDRETVPLLWEAYRRVGPTVETVRSDSDHGSAYVSVRALEALRDTAAETEEWTDLAEVARNLRVAHPSMAALANRVNRAMTVADGDPAAVADAAQRVVTDAFDADAEAAAAAAKLLADAGCEYALTLSRSGTALDALRRAGPRVVVAESRPGSEGVDVAEELAAAGLDVTLAADAAIAYVFAETAVDAAVVGADAILSDGSVVNKVGTRAVGLAADREGVPLYVVAARDKVTPAAEFDPGRADDGALYDGPADLDLLNPLFDRTPADCVAAVVTEDGPLDDDGVAAVAAEHAAAADWDDGADG